MDPDVSLDKVSWVGRWLDWAFVSDCLHEARDNDYPVMDRVIHHPWKAPGVDGRIDCWSIDGAFFSAPVTDSALGRCVADTREDAPWGRVEFNPNKVSDRVLSLMQTFEPDHLTRADVAIDYQADIRDYAFHRPRVKSNVWVGSGGVETLMFGRMVSDRFVRVYDKQLELGGSAGQLMRIEGVGRQKHVLSETLFDGLKVHHVAIDPELHPSVAGKMALRMHYPEVFKRYDKRTRRDVESLVEQLQEPLSPSPNEVYLDSLPALLDDIDRLARGQRVRIARVYRDNQA